MNTSRLISQLYNLFHSFELEPQKRYSQGVCGINFVLRVLVEIIFVVLK